MTRSGVRAGHDPPSILDDAVFVDGVTYGPAEDDDKVASWASGVLDLGESVTRRRAW